MKAVAILLAAIAIAGCSSTKVTTAPAGLQLFVATVVYADAQANQYVMSYVDAEAAEFYVRPNVLDYLEHTKPGFKIISLRVETVAEPELEKIVRDRTQRRRLLTSF